MPVSRISTVGVFCSTPVAAGPDSASTVVHPGAAQLGRGDGAHLCVVLDTRMTAGRGNYVISLRAPALL